jgi:hypothetical protein
MDGVLSSLASASLADDGVWQTLPDDLCKHVAEQCILAGDYGDVPLLRLVCREWKGSIDRCVESLVLCGTRQVAKASKMPYVKQVTIQESATPELIEAISHMALLTKLELRHMPRPDSVGPRVYESLQLLTGLKSLIMTNIESLTDNQATKLLPMTHLTSCEFAHCSHLSTGTLQVLAQLPALQSLTLKGCYRVGDEGLKAFLSGCAPLTQLHILGWCPVTPAGLRSLSELRTLKDLKKGPLKR